MVGNKTNLFILVSTLILSSSAVNTPATQSDLKAAAGSVEVCVHHDLRMKCLMCSKQIQKQTLFISCCLTGEIAQLCTSCLNDNNASCDSLRSTAMLESLSLDAVPSKKLLPSPAANTAAAAVANAVPSYHRQRNFDEMSLRFEYLQFRPVKIMQKKGRPFVDPEELLKAKLEDLKLRYGLKRAATVAVGYEQDSNMQDEHNKHYSHTESDDVKRRKRRSLQDTRSAGFLARAAHRRQESLDDLSEVLLASLEKLRLQYDFTEPRSVK